MAANQAIDAVATVTAVRGTAYARDDRGRLRRLQAGDHVREGETIVTAVGSEVDFAFQNGDTLTLKPGLQRIGAAASDTDPPEPVAAGHAPADALLQAIQADRPLDELLDETAAGLAGGDALEGHGFIRLERISEGVSTAGHADRVAAPRWLPAGPADHARPPANTAPVAVDDRATLIEDHALAGNVLGNDLDADGDALALTGFSIAGIPGGFQPGDTAAIAGVGTLTLHADGRYAFSPAPDYDGPVPVVTYAIADGHGGADSATLAITLVGGDDTPVAGDDAARTPEDTPVTLAVLGNDSDVDGDPLAVVRIGTTAVQAGDQVVINHGRVLLNSDGSLTFMPEQDYNGVTTFSYAISDGITEVPATVTVTVDPVNDAPVAHDDRANTPINQAVDIDVKANDSDPDNARDQLTVSHPVLADPSLGSVSVNPDGSLHFTPAGNVSGDVSLTYTLTDPAGLADTAQVVVHVGANTRPEGADVARSTPEDLPYLVQAADFGFADPDAGQAFHAVRIDTLPNEGSLRLDGQPLAAGAIITVADINAGKLAFAPGPDEHGVPYARFTFSVQDSAGGFDDDANTFTLDVSPVNDSPIAAANRYVTPEDQAVSGNLILDDANGAAPGGVDRDIDGDALRVIRVDNQALAFDPVTGLATVALGHGTLVIRANGDFSFAPAANYNGTQSFSYTVADPGGLTSSAAVVITVDSVNDAPVAKDDPIGIDEDVTSTFDPLANDADTDTPHDQLAIVQLNGRPVDPANPAAYLSTDVHDPVSHVLAGQVSVTSDGQVRFDPAPDYHNDPAHPLVVPYTVADGQGGRDTVNILILVAAQNDAPVAVANHATLLEDSTLNGNVISDDDNGAAPGGVDFDIDGDLLSLTGFSVAGIPGGFQPGDTAAIAGVGTLTLHADGRYGFTPAPDYDGPVPVVTYAIADGHGGADSATLAITLVGGDDTPVAGDDAARTPEDTPVTLAVLGNDSDVDGDPLAVVRIGTTAVQAGDQVVINHGRVLLNSDGSLTFMPEQDYNGVTTFSYAISDGITEVPATVTVTVDPVNDAPVAHDDVANTPINQAVDIDVKANDSDPDNNTRDQLTVSHPVLADPSLGSVSVNPDGSLHFTPAGNVSGDVSLTYTLTDPAGLADTAQVVVHVGANSLPEGADAARTTPEDQPYVIQAGDFGFTDPDAGQAFFAVRIDTLPGNGRLLLNGTAVAAQGVVSVADIQAGRLSFAPDGNENGAPYAQFTFSVQDSAGSFDAIPNALTLNVTPVNDGPIAVANRYATPEDTAVSGNLILDDDNGAASGGVDADLDGDALHVTHVDGQALAFDPVTGLASVALGHGLLTIRANGGFSFAPAANYNGTQSFSYTVADPGGLASSAAVTITVDSRNDAPVAKDDPIVIDEDVTSTFDPLANDADTDTPHDQLAIVQLNGRPVDPAAYPPTAVYDPVSHALAGQVGLTAGGQVRFDPAPDYHSDPAHPLAIPYTIADGQGGFDSALVTISVRAVNDVPVAVDDAAAVTEDDTLPARGNVLANDLDADGDDLDVVGFRQGGTALDSDGTLAGRYGTLTWNAGTGAYAYALDNANRQVQRLGAADTLADNFGYAMTDGHSPGQSAILAITLHGKDDGIVITGIGATGGDFAVREADLPTGSSPDAGGLEKTGSFTIEALDGIQSVSVGGTTLTAAQLTTSTTYPISIATGHGTLVLTGYNGDDQGGSLAYRYTLSTPVDNDSEAGADDGGLVETVAVAVTDLDGDRAASAIHARIIDDAPVARAIAVDGGVQPVNTNLLVILDTSGSMNDPSGMHGLSRIQAAVAGIHELIEQYQSMGRVMVNIAWFNTTAYVQDHGNLGGAWLTVDQARAFLDGLQAVGWTNYDAALAAAMAAQGKPGKLADAQNVAYFLSDGHPTHNDDDVASLGTSPAVDGATTPANHFDDADDGIQAAEQALWRDFLAANDIHAFAIGMGTDVSRAALDPIGYDGHDRVEQPAIEVHDMNDLGSVLASTVRYATSGSLLAGGGLGADGGYVQSIAYAGALFRFDGSTVVASGSPGVAWQYDAASRRLTIDTAGGSLTVAMATGDYSYRHDDPGVRAEPFQYTLADHDGDQATSTLGFSFADSDPAPIVRDDAVVVAADQLAGQVAVRDEWLLWNDSDGNGDPIAITAVTDAQGHVGGQVVDTTGAFGSGSFGYTGSTHIGSSQSDTARVSLRATTGTSLNGDGLDNILVGDDSWETLNGYEGNDVLAGGAGNDDLDGGSGRDWLMGGRGDDRLTGGLLGDVFAWRLADPGTAGTPAVDRVMDFDRAAGDVLDLRDLLDGEQHGGNDIGNLEAYLDIAGDGGDSVVRVSSQGGFAGGHYAAAAEDQRIRIEGVDLYAQYGVAPGHDGDLIAALLRQGSLRVD